jgi:hypothetical protein
VSLEPTGSFCEFSCKSLLGSSVDQVYVDGNHNAIFTCGASIRTNMVMSALRHAHQALHSEDKKLPREKIVSKKSK